MNTFQRSFWSEADSQDTWLSASAPTASGKTFLVSKWLIDALKRGLARVVIYLAPTRALVSEVEGGLSEALANDSSIVVTSLPLRETYLSAMTAGKKNSFCAYARESPLIA